LDQKKVSILILTWNKLQFTKRCLKFLENNTTYRNLEVIIVDNGSKDGTKEFLEKYNGLKGKDFKYILNRSNLGYAAGVNQGVKECKGDYILLLNNDVYVLKNWLQSMVRIAENDEKVSIVGAKLIYPKTKRIQHAGIVFIRKIEPLHIYKNCSLIDPKVNDKRYVDAVTGACMLIKKELIDEIGFFDENYKYGGFEDTDFCLKARRAGKKILYSPKSIAIHDERVTSSQIRGYYKIFNQNYKTFLKNWSNILDNYNDDSLPTSFKLKMYFIFGFIKFVPKRFEFDIKKRLTQILSVH